MKLSIVSAALVAVLVGFGSTIALVVSAAQAVGATEAQTASWAGMLCLATATSTAILSFRYRIPIVAAWSTPGAALIVGATGLTIETAVGAFLAAAGLILVTAAVKPLGRLVERLPVAVAAAMLAGILLRFVLEVFVQSGMEPSLVLPLAILFLLLRTISPSWAVIAVLGVGIILARVLGMAEGMTLALKLTEPTFINPSFDVAVIIGLGLPLYLVTMAGQNLPGYAVLRTFGYTPPTQPILLVTGAASAATAPFGAHMTNLSAITAAICNGPDVHPDPARRWLTGPVYALSYLFLAVFAASFVTLFATLPPALVATIAGLALISPLVVAAGAALQEEATRFAAIVTLAVTASGVSLLDTSSAFWGLVAGLLVLGLDRLKARFAKAELTKVTDPKEKPTSDRYCRSDRLPMPDSASPTNDWSADTVAALKDLEIRQIAYVPDAGLTRILELAGGEDSMTMTSVATEEDAIAMSGGAWLGGQRSLVAMQSSGVGNILNMLTLPRICEMPLLMLVTMRGEPGESNPWQHSTGMAVPAMLEAVAVEVRRVEAASEVGITVRQAGRDAFGENRRICVQIAQSLIGFKGFHEQGEADD